MYPGYRAADVHRLIADELMQFLRDVENGLSPRLVLTVPPRHGKSELASVMFPGWVLGKHPDWFIIHSSYTAELSNDFSRKVRDMMPDPRYQAIFPGITPAKSSRNVKKWGIQSRRGAFISQGVGGALTGRGAHIAIIDDPVKNDQDADSETFRTRQRNWYDSTLRTRIQKGGGIILILTRWHEADLCGYVTEGTGSDRPPGEKWRIVRLPAIAEREDTLGRNEGEALWPEEFSETALEQIKGTIAPRWWDALYQQRPSAQEGNLIKPDKIKQMPEELPELVIFQAWDLAISEKTTADFTVCGTIGVDKEQNVYILDIQRKRTPIRGTVNRIGDMGDFWNPYQIGIEANGFQSAVFQSAADKFLLPFRKLEPDKDKVTRAQLLADRIDMGKVFADKNAPWWRLFDDEARAFPNGDHDDQIDALVYAVLLAKMPRAYAAVGRKIVLPQYARRFRPISQNTRSVNVVQEKTDLAQYQDEQGCVRAGVVQGVTQQNKRHSRKLFLRSGK